MTTVSEDSLLRTVIEMAQRMGVLSAHFRPAQARSGRWMTAVQGDGKGFPDLVLAGAGGVLFRELKADGKYPVPEQKRWLSALSAAGADAGVWRPADLHSGRIEAELRGIRKPVSA